MPDSASSCQTDLRRDFPVEVKLLLECAQQQPDARQADRIRRAASQDVDWLAFQKLVERHRVVPHAHGALSRTASDLVPPSVREALAGRFRANTRRNLLVAGELARICRAMHEAGIPLLCFKGPALALQIYGGLECRQFNDLDLLVPVEHLADAARVLNRLGYCEQGTASLALLSRSQQNRLCRFHKEVEFRRPERPGVTVELHWQLADHNMLPIPPDRLWSDDRQSLAGAPCYVLPELEQLIYLAWHGSKHRWKRLSWLFDLSQAVQQFPETDWNRLQQTAFRLGVHRYVALGLALSRQLLGTCSPGTVFPHVPTRRAAICSCHALLADDQFYERTPFGFIAWTWQMWPRMPFTPHALFHKLAPDKSQIHLPARRAYLKRIQSLERGARKWLRSKLPTS